MKFTAYVSYVYTCAMISCCIVLKVIEELLNCPANDFRHFLEKFCRVGFFGNGMNKM